MVEGNPTNQSYPSDKLLPTNIPQLTILLASIVNNTSDRLVNLKANSGQRSTECAI